jgi:hypothetical protein
VQLVARRRGRRLRLSLTKRPGPLSKTSASSIQLMARTWRCLQAKSSDGQDPLGEILHDVLPCRPRGDRSYRGGRHYMPRRRHLCLRVSPKASMHEYHLRLVSEALALCVERTSDLASSAPLSRTNSLSEASMMLRLSGITSLPV